MTDSSDNSDRDAASRARDAALEAWQQPLPDPERPPGFWKRLVAKPSVPELDDDDPSRTPPRRSAFPPSLFIILAAASAFLAIEPTSDLSYELFGPSQAIDLGHPGAYALDTARDGDRVRISGYVSSVRGTFAKWGDEYEVGALVSIPVLIRRPPQPPIGKDTVESFEGEGRLVRLEDTPSSWFERLVRPAARYSTVRMQFEALGELPFGKTVWLLLVGDVPRAHLLAIAIPILLWIGVVLFAFLARRAYVLRAAPMYSKRRF